MWLKHLLTKKEIWCSCESLWCGFLCESYLHFSLALHFFSQLVLHKGKTCGLSHIRMVSFCFSLHSNDELIQMSPTIKIPCKLTALLLHRSAGREGNQFTDVYGYKNTWIKASTWYCIFAFYLILIWIKELDTVGLFILKILSLHIIGGESENKNVRFVLLPLKGWSDDCGVASSPKGLHVMMLLDGKAVWCLIVGAKNMCMSSALQNVAL